MSINFWQQSEDWLNQNPVIIFQIGINILDLVSETVFGFSYFLRTREGCKLVVTVSRFAYHRDNLYQERSSEIDT